MWLLREKEEKDLIGDRYEDLDWQKISNVDVGLRSWRSFLRISIHFLSVFFLV